ncbi:hypothetical protein [Ethanoligenens sp.]|uniref:hypothetical protein n=1 Tax=Ethanoligenens sp. TaxID=2099655 RepID=UPI0039E7A6B8
MSLLEEQTQYGMLKGIHKLSRYPEGTLKDCTLVVPNTIHTPYGDLVPQYEDDGLRRKFTYSLSFYANGILKSISLQEKTVFNTAQGDIAAELVTFYEDGSIHRLFPLNGKLSGFWAEKNEYELEPVLHFQTKQVTFDKKIIGVSFYPSGAVHSFTFWTRDTLEVELPFGKVETRIGLALYENGAVKSLEPRRPTLIQTPVGKILAYDVEAIGVNGDINSLGLYEDGSLKTVTTQANVITVKKPNGETVTAAPSLHMSHFDDEVKRVEPLIIRFEDGNVVLPNGTFSLTNCTFTVGLFDPENVKISNECDGC